MPYCVLKSAKQAYGFLTGKSPVRTGWQQIPICNKYAMPKNPRNFKGVLFWE
jgi:hypothetical protein